MAKINGFPNCPEDPDWKMFQSQLLAYVLSAVILGGIVIYNCFIKD